MDKNKYKYKTIVIVTLIICITIASIHFNNISILWWFLIIILFI